VFTARYGLGTYLEVESVYCAVRTGSLEVESVYCAAGTGSLYRGGECLLRGTYWVLI